jgi:hypothetical protein
MQFFQADAKTYQTLQTKPEHDGGARASIDSDALEEAKSLPPQQLYTPPWRRYNTPANPFTMSLDPPTYILSLQNNIRARPIPWEGAVRAKTITDADLKKIKSIDKVRKEQRKQTIEGDVDSFTTLLLGGRDSHSIFDAAPKKPDIAQYMLVLTGDLIDGRLALLHSYIARHIPKYMKLTGQFRYSKLRDSSNKAPGAVSTLPASAESFSERGRPNPAIGLRCPLQLAITRPHSGLEEHRPDRRGTLQALQLPLLSLQEL